MLRSTGLSMTHTETGENALMHSVCVRVFYFNLPPDSAWSAFTCICLFLCMCLLTCVSPSLRV